MKKLTCDHQFLVNVRDKTKHAGDDEELEFGSLYCAKCGDCFTYKQFKVPTVTEERRGDAYR